MVRGIEKEKKKKHSLMSKKNYIVEAWLQGGKAIGNIVSSSKKSKKIRNNSLFFKFISKRRVLEP